jgi:hypothetical protein
MGRLEPFAWASPTDRGWVDCRPRQPRCERLARPRAATRAAEISRTDNYERMTGDDAPLVQCL